MALFTVNSMLKVEPLIPPLNKGAIVCREHQCPAYLLFLLLKSAASSSPLKRILSDFTSSRSMLISLSRALAFASAIFLSSSISSIRFRRSDSKALIRSIVDLKLLMTIPTQNLSLSTLKTFAVQVHFSFSQKNPSRIYLCTIALLRHRFNFYIGIGRLNNTIQLRCRIVPP